MLVRRCIWAPLSLLRVLCFRFGEWVFAGGVLLSASFTVAVLSPLFLRLFARMSVQHGRLLLVSSTLRLFLRSALRFPCSLYIWLAPLLSPWQYWSVISAKWVAASPHGILLLLCGSCPFRHSSRWVVWCIAYRVLVLGSIGAARLGYALV